MGNFLQPIRSTTWIWVVMRHQYGFSALVSKASVHRESSGSATKCWLFSQDYLWGIAVAGPLRCKLSFWYLWMLLLSHIFHQIRSFQRNHHLPVWHKWEAWAPRQLRQKQKKQKSNYRFNMENKTSKHHYTYLFLKDAFTVILRLTLSTLIIVVLQSFL